MADQEQEPDRIVGAGARPPAGWGPYLLDLGLRPPYELLQAWPRTPAPQVLADDLAGPALVDGVLGGWCWAVQSRYGRPARTPQGYGPGTKKGATLLAGAALLQDARVAPGAWAAFVMDGWRAGYAPKHLDPLRTPPSPSTVYAPERITPQRVQFFRERAAAYTTGRVLPLGPKARALLALWHRLHEELLRAQARTRGEALAVVQAVLGADREVWDGALWDARCESRRVAEGLGGTDGKG